MTRQYAWACVECGSRIEDYVVAWRHARRHEVVTVAARSELVVAEAVLAQPLGPAHPTNVRSAVRAWRHAVGRRTDDD